MEAPKFSLDEVNKALETTKPYLLDIEEGVQDQIRRGNGIVSFDLRMHNGKVTDVITKHVKRKVLRY